MRVQSRTVIRGLFLCLVVFSTALVGFGFVKWAVVEGGADVVSSGPESVASADGPTVITTSMQGDNRIVAYASNGSAIYYNDTYFVYNDVDPSPEGEYTVTYVATQRLDRSECQSSEPCNRNLIERVNLSTGETERLYSRVTARSRNHWHDADRVGPDRWLVADIAHDRAFVINTSSGIETWSWHAQERHSIESGGIFPGDWTHLNDIERLPDGRLMLSLRNHDSVAFIHPSDGYQANWTVGADENHLRLFEQHNPDYIPAANGGPAVVIADSENNRIVEYQRSNGTDSRHNETWVRTWTWNDTRFRWPRDADRLPNGHTLVTDTNGGRVIEIDKQGDIVWEVDIEGPYEAERLGTGDESTGGPAATQAGLRSRATTTAEARDNPLWEDIADDAVEVWAGILPKAIANPILYVLPPWIGVVELGGLILLGLSLVGWTVAEVYWSRYQLRVTLTKR